MAQVGDPSDFAIAWEETERNDTEVWGHFCFWASGKRIGDYGVEVSLSSAASWLRDFLSHASDRQLDLLAGKSKEELFAYVYETVMITTRKGETLDNAAARHEHEVPSHLRHDWALHSRLRTIFHLDDIGGSAFLDQVNVILVNDGRTGTQRLIWRDLDDMHLQEAKLPDHVFDIVAEQFLAASATPVSLSELFSRSHGNPISVGGRMIYRQYRRQVPGRTEVRVTPLRQHVSIPQGLRIKSGKVDLEVNGERRRDLIIWADASPAERVCRVIGQQGAVLRIWNVWRYGLNATIHEASGNAGMLIEDTAVAANLSCSDGVGAPDFQDLVVRLDFTSAKAT